MVARRLGHTSVKTVLDVYGHLFEGMDEAAAGRLDEKSRTRRAPSSVSRYREGAENPIGIRVFTVGATGFEPVTSAV